MSLIGIDIGSSAVKAVAYRESGSVLARALEAAPSLHPAPGLSESDADEVWRATVRVVRRLTSSPRLRHDPPAALAVAERRERARAVPADRGQPTPRVGGRRHPAALTRAVDPGLRPRPRPHGPHQPAAVVA